MERGSDKHGPRQGDQLAHEVEGLERGGHSTHAEEWKDPEPSGVDQPDVDLVPDGTLEGGVPAGMSVQDVEGRSEVAAALGKEIYPTTGREAVRQAVANNAPDRVVDLLRRLEPGESFQNVQQIWTALAGHVEQRRSWPLNHSRCHDWLDRWTRRVMESEPCPGMVPVTCQQPDPLQASVLGTKPRSP